MPYIAYSFCGPIPVKVLKIEGKNEWTNGLTYQCRVIGKGGPGFKVGGILHNVAGDLLFDKARTSKRDFRTHYKGKIWREKFLR